MRHLPVLAVLVGLGALAGDAEPQDRRNRSLVEVDRRIELMTVVQLLAGYQPLTTVNSTYRADALVHFDAVKDHRAVRLLRDMSEDRFGFDAVPKVMLTLGPLPDLARAVPVEPSVLRRAGGDRKVNEFVAALREFARDSQFDSFFSRHRAFYARIEAALVPDVETAIEPLRRYAGLALDNCILIPGPLIHNGGFQATVGADPAAKVYAIIGPFGERDGEPLFSENASVAWLAQHEFSHSFVNPLVEQFSREVDRSRKLYDPIKADMQKQAYGDWQTAVHEHIIRAITARLAFARSPESGERVLAIDEGRGFKYVRALAARLEEYEAARDRYPTFESFFPRLLAVFTESMR